MDLVLPKMNCPLPNIMCALLKTVSPARQAQPQISTSCTSCGTCGAIGTCSGKPISASETSSLVGVGGSPETRTCSGGGACVLARAPNGLRPLRTRYSDLDELHQLRQLGRGRHMLREADLGQRDERPRRRRWLSREEHLLDGGGRVPCAGVPTGRPLASSGSVSGLPVLASTSSRTWSRLMSPVCTRETTSLKSLHK